MHAIRIDRTKPLAGEPHSGHNRYHPEIAPSGAGEPSIRPVAAAIANAIFDATGVRIRRVPFSPDRVKQSLS